VGAQQKGAIKDDTQNEIEVDVRPPQQKKEVRKKDLLDGINLNGGGNFKKARK